ncbi:MAG: anion permease [Candidatus Omnitrophica bacterium]|jgi:Na+/H+ antiporter NhaD/arsenite permease-like protein|nr:anion permease [Candidatus Omnitrophota bacterium]
MKIKVFLVISISLLIAFSGLKIGFSPSQATTTAVFFMSLLGIFFFWDLRLSFVFFGAGILLITRSVDLENLLKFASLDVILFLIGMMILVGMLNEAGLIVWAITKLLTFKGINGKKMFFLIMAMSAFSSSLMGEVSSIIIMVNIIIAISEFFDMDPVPLLISSVLATNIGSSATVLGNPIGVLIAARGKLTFEDFITHAFPITVVVFLVTIIILFLWYRNYIKELDKKLISISENKFFLSLITIPADRKVRISLSIFTLTVIAIALHKRFEAMFGLEENTLLFMLPIFAAGIVLLYRRDKVRHYIEREIEWTSILFFLFLFAQASVIKYSGISDFFANKIIAVVGDNKWFLSGLFLYSSGFLSSILDNTVVVASYVPTILSLSSSQAFLRAIWWAVLFGACYGGNITAIGSTANIVALDILEKKTKKKISFLKWLKIGLVVGIVSMTSAFILIFLFNP